MIMNLEIVIFLLFVLIIHNSVNAFNNDSSLLKTSWIESNNIFNWYSPSDICTLYKWNKELIDVLKTSNYYNNSSRNNVLKVGLKIITHKHIDILKKISASCLNYTSIELNDKKKPNYLNEYACKSPSTIIDRPYFFRSIYKYDNPNESKKLINTIIHLIKTNRSIVFFGDSMSEHSFENFRFELQRLLSKYENPPLTIGNIFNDKNNDSIQANNVMRTLFNQINPSPYFFAFDITLNNDNNNNNINNKITTLIFRYNIYYGEGHFRKYFDSVLKVINKFYDGLVIIGNIGLWINQRSRGYEYFEKILTYLNNYNNINTNNIIIWRETTSQHFPGRINGYFDSDDIKKQKNNNTKTIYTCVKNQINIKNFNSNYNTNNTIDWRNEDVKYTIKKYNLTNINYINGFYDITKPLYKMHRDMISNSGVDKLDCTHYCWWPMLWQLLYQEITKIIINKYNIKVL